MLRRFIVAVAMLASAAGCGSSTTAPQNQSGGCQLTNGKVQVVINYARDRASVPAAFVSNVPTVALSDRGDSTVTTSTNPQMTRVDDYSWTLTVSVVPNTNPMSHSATVIDLGLSFAGAATPYAVTGVTANGVQLLKVTSPPIGPFTTGIDIGYFGVDACGKVSA